MDLFALPLTILFKEQNPYLILENLYSTTKYNSINYRTSLKKDRLPSYKQLITKQSFENLYMQLNHERTKEEINNIYSMTREFMNEDKSILYIKDSSVYKFLENYNEYILEAQGETVRCNYKSLLKWRTITLSLDPDMLLTSFLVCNDITRGYKRRDFTWETIIKSDNIRLHDMLSNGMAENHFHLKGSTPVFKLAWIALMNWPLRKELWYEKKRLTEDIDGNVMLPDLIFIARIIRLILFSKVKNERNEIILNEELIKWLEDILRELVTDKKQNGRLSISSSLRKMNSVKIQQIIDSLQLVNSAEIKYKGKKCYVDYVLSNDILKITPGWRLFVGERAFMYKCFNVIFKNEKHTMTDLVADLFYAYLIIKNKVRSEFIQTNQRIGFSNFSDYQSRKTMYLPENSVLKESVEPTAIVTSIKSQNIVSLEARIMPMKSMKDNVKYIKDIDGQIQNSVFNDCDNHWMSDFKDCKSNLRYKNLSNEERRLYFGDKEYENINNHLLERYFYVYHFPKYADSVDYISKKNLLLNQIHCRNYNLRKNVKMQALSLYEMREHSQEEASRVLGIDACSNELEARPEAFGQVFRFLKAHLPKHNYMRSFKNKPMLNRLRATYHVGEEFLDIADGLRTIDEAVSFLELRHGDRLGHATVLGIDVKDWYQRRSNRVYLSKQDLLDNIAWVIAKIKYYDITIRPNAIEQLSALYNRYYSEIYMKNRQKSNEYTFFGHQTNNSGNYTNNESYLPADIYYAAWELRGDDPECYCPYIHKSQATILSRYSVRNMTNSPTETIRELYYRYHYDVEVKQEGAKKTVFRITPYFIDVIKEIQKDMQLKLRECGIGIETNPTSNVLINSFRRYDKHPIINMYSKELNDKELSDNPQLFVSINTDDQGVFDTLLENEFALMGIALEKIKNEDGKSKYDQARIYEWLDKIRQMGIEQSFRHSNKLN